MLARKQGQPIHRTPGVALAVLLGSCHPPNGPPTSSPSRDALDQTEGASAPSENITTHTCAKDGTGEVVLGADWAWTVTALNKWHATFWVVHSSEKTGTAELLRFFITEAGGKVWAFDARWSFVPASGRISAETTGSPFIVEKVGVEGNAAAGEGRVEETDRWFLGGKPLTTGREVVLVATRGGDVFSHYKEMHRCATEALAMAK